jgi:hypothetical protein
MMGYERRIELEHLQNVHFLNLFAEFFSNQPAGQKFRQSTVNPKTVDCVMPLEFDVVCARQLTIFNHQWANMSSRCREFG